jgi:hypothetical protein
LLKIWHTIGEESTRRYGWIAKAKRPITYKDPEDSGFFVVSEGSTPIHPIELGAVSGDGYFRKVNSKNSMPMAAKATNRTGVGSKLSPALTKTCPMRNSNSVRNKRMMAVVMANERARLGTQNLHRMINSRNTPTQKIGLKNWNWKSSKFRYPDSSTDLKALTSGSIAPFLQPYYNTNERLVHSFF